MKIEKIYLSAEDEDFPTNPIGCTDVIVFLNNGAKYFSTFFSFDEVDKIREIGKQTGEFLNGSYFRAEQMILAENCSRSLIQKVIEHLMEEGEFGQAFKRL